MLVKCKLTKNVIVFQAFGYKIFHKFQSFFNTKNYVFNLISIYVLKHFRFFLIFTPVKFERKIAIEKQNKTKNDTLEKIVSLAKRRGFVFQSSEIYGGLNGCWDYGPLGS